MQENTSTTTTRSHGAKSNGKWKAQAQAQGDTSDQSQILNSAQKAYDTVVEKASEMFAGFKANPTTYIRQYPIQAALGGVVVGLLLGAAISRRSVTKE